MKDGNLIQRNDSKNKNFRNSKFFQDIGLMNSEQFTVNINLSSQMIMKVLKLNSLKTKMVIILPLWLMIVKSVECIECIY